MGHSTDPRPAHALPPAGSDSSEVDSWGPARSPDTELPRVYAFASERGPAHLWDYWSILFRHRWTILVTFGAALVAGSVWAWTQTPIFTATVTLRIERERPPVLKFGEVVPEDADRAHDYYQTQYRILRSRSLANRVIGMLALDQEPEFRDTSEPPGLLVQARARVAQAGARVRSWLLDWFPSPATPSEPSEPREDVTQASPLTSAFLSRLTIQPMRDTRLVEASFESRDPALAALVTNALADAFISQNLEEKVAATRHATDFLAKELEQARVKLEESEKRLGGFLKRNRIFFLGADGGAGRGEVLVSQQLTVLSDALLRARVDRIGKQSAFVKSLNEQPETLSAVLGNAVIQRFKEQLATLKTDYERQSSILKPNYPDMRQLARSIEELTQQVEAETERVVKGLETDYRGALRAEKELQRAVDRHQDLATRLGAQMAEYRVLRREADANQELYTTLLTRLKETGVAASLLTSNITIVDRAEAPLSPSKPQNSLMTLIAGALGLLGGVGLALFLEYLDTTIKDAKEVSAVLGLPTLGVVPSRAALERQRARRGELDPEDSAPFALIAHTEMASIVAEAFRTLRASLLYSSPDHPPRTLMVTSPGPSDGKTSLATNLAIVLAQLDVGNILLVDGDLRRPQLHAVLDVPQSPGLSTFLTGQVDLSEVIRPTRVPNLYVIPSGQVPVNPAELMSSARLRGSLDELTRRFAHVLFDAPPLFGVSDAMALAPRLDGVLLVLRYGRSSRDAAQRAVSHLASIRARLRGVILNDVNVQGVAYQGVAYRGPFGYPSGPAAGVPDAERYGSRLADQ